jgi:hypothetical protein
MSDLAIRFTIDTPIALNQLLHLDSLLARISADRGLGVEDLSLDRTGDIYHASAAILETGNFGAVQQETTRVKSVRSADIPTGVFDRVPRRGRAINEMSPYRSQLQGYNTYLGVKAVWFTAKGVRSSLERMAASVTNLGAMASTGYGRVSGVDIFDLPSHPRTGLHSKGVMGFLGHGRIRGRHRDQRSAGKVPLLVWLANRLRHANPNGSHPTVGSSIRIHWSFVREIAH